MAIQTYQQKSVNLESHGSRDPYFDVVKLFAIVLVVYGHVSGAFGCMFGYPWIRNFIIGMNMPLFFIISGYFLGKTIKDGNWRKFGKHILSYAWPTVVVSVVFAVLAVAFHIKGGEVGVVGYAGRRFLFSPWFLWCLAVCYAVTFFCFRLKLPVLRGGAVLLLITVFPFLRGVWYAAEVRAMLPFFLLGVFMLRKHEIWKDWRVGISCLSAYLFGVLILGDIRENGLSFYGADTTWFGFAADYKLVFYYFVRLANGFLGSVGVMWLLKVISVRFKMVARLAPFGTTTLGVYILHQWLLDRIVDFGWCDDTIGMTLACVTMLFLFCHFIVVFTKRTASLRLAIWGDGVIR